MSNQEMPQFQTETIKLSCAMAFLTQAKLGKDFIDDFEISDESWNAASLDAAEAIEWLSANGHSPAIYSTMEAIENMSYWMSPTEEMEEHGSWFMAHLMEIRSLGEKLLEEKKESDSELQTQKESLEALFQL